MAAGLSVLVLANIDLPYPRSTVPAGAEAPVYVMNSETLSHEDSVTLQTLAGVLARHTPRVYTVDSPPAAPSRADTTHFWLQQLQLQTSIVFRYDYLNAFYGLLDHFAHNITGFVRYNARTNSANAALIYCAAHPGSVIAVANNATAAHLTGIGVPLVADVSHNSCQSN